MIQDLLIKPSIRLITKNSLWMESDALEQLEKTARFDGMVECAGMPDMHPGKGSPVGAAFLTRNIFYPHIIGNDAGCGMSLFQTTLKTKKVKKEKWAEALIGFDTLFDQDISGEEESSTFDPALGTLGGGNHFAELQRVEKVMDESVFRTEMGDSNRLFLLVHSGSRYHGELLYRYHTGAMGAGPLAFGSHDAAEYFNRYAHAIQWASANRTSISERFMARIGGRAERLLDLCHNSISVIENDDGIFGLHRKGAAPSDQGLVVVPGSRGAFTYLVQPIGNQDKNLWSVAHGAGRKWNRGSCKGKLSGTWTAKTLKHTDLGSIVVCNDRDLLFEEAPQAYKNVDSVIEAMVESGLIRVIAMFRPVITCKGGV